MQMVKKINDLSGTLLYKLAGDIKNIKKFIGLLRNYDVLTGLFNLVFIRKKLVKLLSTQYVSPQYVSPLNAVFLLGVDNFTAVNIRFGSAYGDCLLKAIAARLQSYCGKDKIIARKGGDEFIIVINKVGSHQEVAKLAQEILDLLLEKFKIAEQVVYITASMGISLCPQDTFDSEEILTNTEIALRYVKNNGKNNYQFFTQIMGKKAKYIQKIQTSLPRALERKEFLLYFQPQVTSSGKIIGFEALLRWQHPTLGLLGPNEFISIAEEQNYIIPIGNWVLQEACEKLKEWHRLNHFMRIAVNISGRQFFDLSRKSGECLIVNVQKSLESSGIEPVFLELEVTERMVMNDMLLVGDYLKRLKKIGVRIACDDFGVGYSSFSRLKSLPLDTIKIDQSLINDLPNNKIDKVIVQGIISISKQLQACVVAEGVERFEQYEISKQLGCDLIQGFYTGRPMSAEKVTEFLRNDYAPKL